MLMSFALRKAFHFRSMQAVEFVPVVLLLLQQPMR